MRIINRHKAFERHAYRLDTRRRATGCRVFLRVPLYRFLLPMFHRPTGCAWWHTNARPLGWAGERP